ncbi:hypothetical protein SNEBB_000071 [Seison nebaliae]|nr:hypothetical protein SNEBB_000071 [Seison nebaliae]
MRFFFFLYVLFQLGSINCIRILRLCLPRKLNQDVVNIPSEIPDKFELANNNETNVLKLFNEIKNSQSVDRPEPIDMFSVVGFTSPRNMVEAFSSVNKYLNKKEPSIIFRPNNIPKTIICDPLINIDDFVYHNFSSKSTLGTGVQGVVYKMKNDERQCLAYKIFTQLSDFLMQVNAMTALRPHFPQYRIYSIEQNDHIEKFDWFYNDGPKMLDLKAPFCMAMTYLRGGRPNWSMQNSYSNMKKLKRNFRFLLLILKQLQVLHFSFNHYPVVEDSDIFGAFSFTMFHGDLHGGNILMTRDETSEHLYPQMIDIGYKFGFMIGRTIHLFDVFYNHHLFNEKLPIEQRKKNIVLRNQLLNELQSLDFCMLGMFILAFFMGNLGIQTAPMIPCVLMQHSLNLLTINREMHRSFYTLFHNSPYWPLMAIFFHSRRIETSYADVWSRLFNMLFVQQLVWVPEKTPLRRLEV